MPPNTPCACFNTQPPEGGCRVGVVGVLGWVVSTHSRPKAAASCRASDYRNTPCFNTQPPEGGCGWPLSCTGSVTVSTHSRPKAAAYSLKIHYHLRKFQHTAARRRLKNSRRRNWRICCFNTQPPEGGWCCITTACWRAPCFNTQPPEGGWLPCGRCLKQSTRFNTQPPEGGCVLGGARNPCADVSTHSRPKAADGSFSVSRRWTQFQHTAARRRLGIGCTFRSPFASFNTQPPEGGWGHVPPDDGRDGRFNTQPPEGGCFDTAKYALERLRFNTQPPEGGCKAVIGGRAEAGVSTHSRPKAAALIERAEYQRFGVSTHSRPKAAALGNHLEAQSRAVSTHSRPKAAARKTWRKP